MRDSLNGARAEANCGFIAFAAGSKQSGYNIDPKTQEKITDGGREAYEKFSG